MTELNAKINPDKEARKDWGELFGHHGYEVTYDLERKELQIADSTYKYVDFTEKELKDLIAILRTFGLL